MWQLPDFSRLTARNIRGNLRNMAVAPTKNEPVIHLRLLPKHRKAGVRAAKERMIPLSTLVRQVFVEWLERING